MTEEKGRLGTLVWGSWNLLESSVALLTISALVLQDQRLHQVVWLHPIVVGFETPSDLLIYIYIYIFVNNEGTNNKSTDKDVDIEFLDSCPAEKLWIAGAVRAVLEFLSKSLGCQRLRRRRSVAKNCFRVYIIILAHENHEGPHKNWKKKKKQIQELSGLLK